MTRTRTILAVTIIGSLVAVAAARTSIAQVAKGKTRPLQTKHLMSGVVKVHCSAIKDALKGELSDKIWDEMTAHAALLNESSYVLMEDGRCPDAIWADAATKGLRKGSEDLLKAIAAKDAAAAKESLTTVTKACGSCHDKHKKKEK